MRKLAVLVCVFGVGVLAGWLGRGKPCEAAPEVRQVELTDTKNVRPHIYDIFYVADSKSPSPERDEYFINNWDGQRLYLELSGRVLVVFIEERPVSKAQR